MTDVHRADTARGSRTAPSTPGGVDIAVGDPPGSRNGHEPVRHITPYGHPGTPGRSDRPNRQHHKPANVLRLQPAGNERKDARQRALELDRFWSNILLLQLSLASTLRMP